MVHVVLKPGLLACEMSQPSPRRPGPMSLQPFTALLVPLAFSLDRLARVHRAVRVHSKVDDTKVHAKHVLDADGLWLKDITDDRKVKRPLDVHQVHLALAKSQQGALSCAALVGHLHAALHGPQRQLGVRAQTEDAIIVGLRGIAPETTASLAVQFIGIGHFGNTAHGHLCGKAKLGTTAFIRELVQGELAKRVGLPCLFRQPCAGTVRHLQRVQQRRMLFWGGSQLEIRHKFHISSIEHLTAENKQTCWPCRPTSFPPRPKRRGLSEVFR